ncbi:hypothetical protein [Dyella caseinilytica]|uniref:Uncharacterized protein n=1 Tax=Dyella caseinilytica TaxID=1849581 RepID=A0ABX7GR70_9GAMM|nr:hypothetical protein [Dyella caseinilytica]QRN52419.1 hypothetical protein ISN74_13130 [Dyella caseinilytica]GGA05814.1 hypothetical protein GCM10011408_28460 [Dyella caseinilytica]
MNQQPSDKVISHDGDTWRVLAQGRVNEDGDTYCHLASTTRFRVQRNGRVPVQMVDYIAAEVLA